MFVLRLAPKKKELKYLGLDVKLQIEPVNHDNIQYMSAVLGLVSEKRALCQPKKVAKVFRDFGDNRTSWLVLNSHVSPDCDLAKVTQQE